MHFPHRYESSCNMLLLCSLCQCVVSEGRLSSITDCGHCFCLRCIDHRFKVEENTNCPVCGVASTVENIVPVYCSADTDDIDNQMNAQVRLANESYKKDYNSLMATTSQVRLTLAMFEKIRASNSAVMQSLHQNTQSTGEELQAIQRKAEAVEEECHQTKAQCLEVNLSIDRAQKANEQLKEQVKQQDGQ